MSSSDYFAYDCTTSDATDLVQLHLRFITYVCKEHNIDNMYLGYTGGQREGDETNNSNPVLERGEDPAAGHKVDAAQDLRHR